MTVSHCETLNPQHRHVGGAVDIIRFGHPLVATMIQQSGRTSVRRPG